MTDSIRDGVIPIVRNAKFWGLKFSPEFMSDYRKTVAVINSILSELRKGLVSGEIVKIDRFKIYTKDRAYSAAEYNKKFLSHLYDVEDKWSMKRQLLFYAMERYTGYANRNDNKKVPSITIKQDKSLYYKESGFIEVNLDESKLVVKTLWGEHDVPFSYSLKAEHIKMKKGKKVLTTGGNFIISQRAFVAAVDFNVDVLYEPTGVLANDLNKSSKSWNVFNDGSIITPNSEISRLTKEIFQLNKLLDQDKKLPVHKRQLNSKERRKVRLAWKAAHKRLRGHCLIIADEICSKAIESESLLCIDSVKTGQKNGTFGQDHLIPALQTMCENRGIPFYVVPCANTSRRCSECGHIHKDNRVDTDNFSCQECGHQCDAQLNGAINIAYQGSRLFEAGVPFGNWARRKVDTLVEKYSQQQMLVGDSKQS